MSLAQKEGHLQKEIEDGEATEKYKRHKKSREKRIVNLDLKSQITPKETLGSSHEKAIIPIDSQADPTIDVPHIDFIFYDHHWKSEGHHPMAQILYFII